MFGTSYQIAKIWGIPIKVHISLVFLLAYVGLRGGLLIGREYGWAAGGVALIEHLLLVLLVFVSVAMHELGHSFVAIRKGCRVRQITLMVIGGAAQMDRMPSRPRGELLMALAGPLVSLVIGSVLLTSGIYLRNSGWTLPVFLMLNLGLINLLLAGFNLLPAFPMDGGRILRAALTPRMGRLPATRVASQIGRWLAIGMGFFAVINGYWIMVAIAFYIYIVGGAEYRMMQIQETFQAGRRFFDDSPQNGADSPFSWGRRETAGEEEEDDDDDDDVIISPPPYRKGPAERVDIRRERSTGRNPFFS